MKNLINKAFQLISGKKQLLENFSFVGILQIFQLLIAFISYPYLIRVLGKETYGLVIFAQTVVNYFVILINFGFKTIITYEIAANIHSVMKISKIVSSTYFAKLIYTLFSFILLVLLILIFPRFHQYYLLYLFSFLFCLGELLLPIWFFQAIEKMKYITIINIIVKSFFLILIFIYVKSPEDYLLVPLFLGIGSFIGGLTGLIIMYKTRLTNEKRTISLILPDMQSTAWVIKRSTSYFLSNIAATIKGKTSNLFIGIFLNYESVAIYDICFKVINILNTIFTVFNTVLFPRVVKTKEITKIKNIYRFLFALGIFLFIGVFIGAKPIVIALGGKSFEETGKIILRIMSFALPFSGGIVGLGGLTLVGLKKDKYFTYGIILVLLFYIISIVFLILFNKFTLLNVAYVYLLCILFEFAVHRYNVKKLKIY